MKNRKGWAFLFYFIERRPRTSDALDLGQGLVQGEVRAGDDAELGPILDVEGPDDEAGDINGIGQGQGLVAGSRNNGFAILYVEGEIEGRHVRLDVRHAPVVHEIAVDEPGVLQPRGLEGVGGANPWLGKRLVLGKSIVRRLERDDTTRHRPQTGGGKVGYSLLWRVQAPELARDEAFRLVGPLGRLDQIELRLLGVLVERDGANDGVDVVRLEGLGEGRDVGVVHTDELGAIPSLLGGCLVVRQLAWSLSSVTQRAIQVA